MATSYKLAAVGGVNLIESLSKEEKATIYKMLDAFIGKKKLKDTLANVLKDME